MSDRGKRTYAYYAWDDPGPILNSLGRIVEAGVNRVKRRLHTRDTERARIEKNRPKKAMQPILLAADPTVGQGLRRVTVD